MTKEDKGHKKMKLADVKRDKDGYYIETTIRIRLPVGIQTKTKDGKGSSLVMHYDVEGYMKGDVGLSFLYRLLDKHWSSDKFPTIPEVDANLIDRFFEQWYQLTTFKKLGHELYPIIIDVTEEQESAIPFAEFEKK